MPLPLVIRPAARVEFDEAADWYERRRVGLGDQFVAAVWGVFRQIAADPHRYAAGYRKIRGAQVPGFRPYYVYFRVGPARIEVISVFHSSRNPRGWQSRL